MGTLRRRALTLIEVCVAMAVLSVFVLVASGLESQGVRALKSIQHRQAAQRLASDLEERIRAGLEVSEGDQSVDGLAYHYSVKRSPAKGGLEPFEFKVTWKSITQQELSISRSGQRLVLAGR